MTRLTPLSLLLVAACSLDMPVDYYQGHWDPPEITSIESKSQAGNISGTTVTIRGSGFGEAPDEGELAPVMVQFGSANAVVVSMSDTELVVSAPPGPVGGGTVQVRVGTYNGYDTAEYTYDVGDAVVAGDGEHQTGQVGYILVNNYWESCFGGLTERLNDAYGVTDCQTFAYVGTTGIDGTAEAIEFPVDRLHSTSQGWSGAPDLADGEWRVERPGEQPYLGGLDDFHVDLGKVSITNPFWDEDDGFCVDFAELASYRYGGGEADTPDAQVISGSGLPTTKTSKTGTCDDGAVYYAADELEFCQRESSEGVPSYVYEVDWPVSENFFKAHARNLKPADVLLNLPDIGVDGLALQLPEPMVVYNTEGYDDILTDGSEPGAQDLWSAYGAMQHCYDDASNGERLDDVALVMEWPVSDFEPTPVGGKILHSRTYVRMSITQMTLGWFGGINYPVRATVTVPDEYETYKHKDAEGNVQQRSRLEVPASVMYQLPTIAFPPSGGLGGVTYAVPGEANYGYMFIELQRVTEYTVSTDIGPVVLAYVTGDFGFTDWTNPKDDACHDCEDGDRDGWLDDKDPDCDGGVDEVGMDSAYACNDGVDNDGDGLEDSADEDCASATDDDESNCDNKLDDDGDGFKDDADADCARGDSESTADGCVDGLDGDTDGWVDAADPDCATGSSEDGLGDADCNDGLDGDADGWTDAEDPDCLGASFTEQGFGTSACNDGVDNDADNVTDAADNECVDASDVSEEP